MRVPAVVALAAVLAVAAEASGPRLRHRQVQNKHTPKFKACDDYKPEVAEEAPRGKTGSGFSGMSHSLARPLTFLGSKGSRVIHPTKYHGCLLLYFIASNYCI